MSAGDPIQNYSDLIFYATSAGEQVPFSKGPREGGAAATAPVAGRISSLWKYDGQPGGATATPGASATCDNTTAGALGQSNLSGGGVKKRLVSVTAGSLVAGVLILYDRLVHMGGLDGTNTGAQTVSTSALPRQTTGAGVEAAIEIYTQIGVTGQTATVSYTNSAGTSGQTSPSTAIGNTGLREQDRMLPIPIVSGDKGIRAVSTLTLSGSTGTAGNFGVTLIKRFATLSLPLAGVGDQWNSVLKTGGPVDLNGNACLAWMWVANTTTVPELIGLVNLLEK